MSRPDSDPSVDREPFQDERPARPDPSERAADRVLGRAHRGPGDRQEEQARHSVFDEPDILPGRTPETITQDWFCRRCGYNRRGLQTGGRCPECGEIELYRPPPDEAPSLAAWYRDRRQRVSPLNRWGWLALAMVFGSLLPFLGTVVGQASTFTTRVLIGPSLEEVLKLALLIYLVESRPFLFRRTREVWLPAVGGALGFALLQNSVYSVWILAAPTLGMVLWRWMFCTALHITCTAVAAAGLVRVWRRSEEEARRPRLHGAAGSLAAAIMLHAVYNACVMMMDLPEFLL
ncbi:MAG: PrsW family glutamic-type intramembrane protease [Phycisphaerae bacterium]